MIKAGLTGIGSVSFIESENCLEFTNKTDGSKFKVSLPTTFHDHANENVLELLDVDADGNLTYDGQIVNLHDNIDVLEELGESVDGNLTYKGKEIMNSSKVEGFYYEVTAPSDIWTIVHDLDALPSRLCITCMDTEGNVIIGDINTELSTEDKLVINFNEEVAGSCCIK